MPKNLGGFFILLNKKKEGKALRKIDAPHPKDL